MPIRGLFTHFMNSNAIHFILCSSGVSSVIVYAWALQPEHFPNIAVFSPWGSHSAWKRHFFTSKAFRAFSSLEWLIIVGGRCNPNALRTDLLYHKLEV